MAFEFKLPDIGEGVVEGEIVQWLIKPGEEVADDQIMVEVMTDKATVEIPSPVTGTVSQTIGKEGDVIEVGAVMVVIETGEETPPPPRKAESTPDRSRPKPQQRAKAPAPGSKVLATPALRKQAREAGIDLTQVEGTGPGGRIRSEDLDRFLDASKPAPAAASAQPIPPITGDTVPYRGLRKKIGDHLIAAKRFAPHYTYVEEVDVSNLVATRKSYLAANPAQKISYLPFLIQAVVHGLKKFPLLNASLDEENQVIQLHREYNIGLAVNTEDGLIVPVLRQADQKGLLELLAEIDRLAGEAREGRARLEDLRGGTFTITSLGSLGGVLATPILNYPEVAIMGVHKISERPVVRNGQIVIREMMNLSLSLDHRVVDGAIGAEFLNYVIRYLENLGLLLLE